MMDTTNGGTMYQLLLGLIAAAALVGPVLVISTAFAIAKDGSPFNRNFWS